MQSSCCLAFVLCAVALAARVEIFRDEEPVESHETTRGAQMWCGCEQVTRPEACSRSRTLTVRDNAFFCCAWFPRSGHGRTYQNKVGWVSKDSFRNLPFSLATSDANTSGQVHYEHPAEENRRACSTHIRNKGLQARNGEKCGLPGHCAAYCCCAWNTVLEVLRKERTRGTCMTPAACKDKGYKCLDKVNPTLSELSSLKYTAFKWTRVEDVAQATSYRWYHRVDKGPEPKLKVGEPGVCFLLRKTGLLDLGLGGVAALGSNAAQIAADMKVFHFDVTYAKSPYLNSMQEKFVSREESLHIIPWSHHCRKGDEVYPRLVNKWGFRDEIKLRLDETRFGTQAFGRTPKFTYAISANSAGLLEFRFAMMEATSGNKFMSEIMDLNGKHAFLAHTEDWVLYAGEAWVQFTPEAVAECAGDKFAIIECLKEKMSDPASNAMLIIDNDSGTFKASPDLDVRSKVLKLLHTAWGSQYRINVCSLPGLIDDELDNFAGAPCSDIKWVRAIDITGTGA